MKRHLQRCGVLFCALLIVPGMVAELHAQTSIAPPDSLVFRDPFLDEGGNVIDQNAAAPGRIEFRAPFLDDSGALMIFLVPSVKEVRQFAESDPIVQSGLVEYSIHPWAVAVRSDSQ